jgi:carbon-monoxide dehydrogenase large subunit
MVQTADLKEREQKLQGMGTSLLRKEDARFIRGQGSYVDDIKMPGMLFGAIVRSPYAHARIKGIDKSKALACPGVVAVLTAADLKPVKLDWMPTVGGDVQAVLADKKVHFQYQDVAMVLATDRAAAYDGAALVEVDYDELPAIVDPKKALLPDAPVLREDIVDKKDLTHGPRTHPNHIFTWEAGDKAAADAAFKSAAITVREEILNPRVHPCPLETCGCVASFNKATGYLTLYVTTQIPHLFRTVLAMLSGIPESKIRVVGGDIGGGFGNKVPVYPGYVVATVASIVTGVPVKWIESRIDNISTTGFARDYHGVGELAADKDGRIKGLRFTALADHGAFNSHVSATKFPAGLFSICTGSYAIPNTYCRVDAVFTNKAPGGVAYRCSLRVTEAIYLIERMMDVLAQKTGIDKAEIRRRNFVKAEQFPYTTGFGWTLDSGNYHAALDKVLKAVDYEGLRREQAAKRADPKSPTLMGIGLSTFTEIVGAGPTKVCDILGVGLFDSCEIRVHPTGGVIARLGTMSQGQGHSTTYAQIIATELGLPASDIVVEEGDTDKAPYGAGTWGSRSTPVSGAATAVASRKIDRFKVKGNPAQFKTMKELCMVSHTGNLPAGMEQGLNAVAYYDPPNLTFPFGAYLSVVDIDKFTGEVKVRRFYALDDCGTRINPMIIDGQVHGGLTEAFAVAMGQQIPFDENGNHLGNSLMDYFLPTAVETPTWETDHTVTPCPHHPLGAKGVAESPHVGGIPCFSNAVIDAFAHLGVTHMDMPHSAYRVWQKCNALGLNKR